uniref:G protein-coupled receptor 153 n=5 Tax=Callorhinchus milii TaxID=7868 RepID=A0A4W3GVT9_CALMI
MGIWMVSFILSTLPAVGWHDTTERFYARDCRFIVTEIGLGFGVCFLLLISGSVVMGVVCIGITLFQTFSMKAAHNADKNKFNVPTIVVEDAQGKRRSSIDGSEPIKTSLQITYLISGIVFIYDFLAGFPVLVLSFTSLKYDKSYTWMVLCFLWCSIVQSILLPTFLWACDRYRADVKSVWEKCVAIMSNDELDDENSQDGAIHPESFFERAYDYNCTAEVLTIDRIAKYDFSALERGAPQLYTVREMQEDKMQYLQVPPTRRYSHDETDVWTANQIPSYLNRWGSSEDITGAIHYVSPRYERRRSSLVSEHDDCASYHKRRKSVDSVVSLKQLYRDDYFVDDLTCFSREEIIKYIDDSPLPSPMKSPLRLSSISLSQDKFKPSPVTYSHFPLTNFEREPQVLRRLTEYHGKGSVLGHPSCPKENLPQPFRARHAEPDGSYRNGERRSLQAQDSLVTITMPRGREQSCQNSRTELGVSWERQEKLAKMESKGSTNSFLTSPSGSSGYVTFHLDSIGSTS